MKKFKQISAVSLIDLTVTLSMVAILSGISFSTYSKLQIEHRRNEALVKVIKLKNNLQQMAISGGTSVIDVINKISSNQITIPNETDGYYTYQVQLDNAGYTIVATPITGKSQEKDKTCKTIILRVIEGREDTKDPLECWGKN